jgi:hypothetical protein
VDFSQVLEKGELVNRVMELIVDERKRLERQRLEEEREAGGNGNVENGSRTEGLEENTNGEREGEAKRVPTGPVAEVERGLCVVCQDEEATLAVVDCGHLAMCARESWITFNPSSANWARLYRLLRSDHGYESGVSSV